MNSALSKLAQKFGELYSKEGRPSIPPERLLRASLLQLLYSLRSERQLMERLDFDLLFRWLVGLGIDDPVWDHSVFSKNRDRLLTSEIAQDFLTALLAEPKVKRLLSHEHLSVYGTLLKAWASMKSFRRKDGSGDPPDGGRNGEQNFRGEQRSDETHESTTDPDARSIVTAAAKRAGFAIWAVHSWSRDGLAICGEVTHATGTAVREVALAWADQRRSCRRLTFGADKAYDVFGFVQALKEHNITPHVAINGTIGANGIPRKTRHPGYSISQCIRKRIEEIFGWIKSTGGLTQLEGPWS